MNSGKLRFRRPVATREAHPEDVRRLLAEHRRVESGGRRTPDRGVAYHPVTGWTRPASGDVTVPGETTPRHRTCTATRDGDTWSVPAQIDGPSGSPSPSPSE